MKQRLISWGEYGLLWLVCQVFWKSTKFVSFVCSLGICLKYREDNPWGYGNFLPNPVPEWPSYNLVLPLLHYRTVSCCMFLLSVLLLLMSGDGNLGVFGGLFVVHTKTKNDARDIWTTHFFPANNLLKKETKFHNIDRSTVFLLVNFLD